MASHMGLLTKRLRDADIVVRLKHVYKHRLDIGKLKTDDKTYQWFRVANCPARPSDGLGPYKFLHDPTASNFEFDQKAILSA